MTKRPDLLSVEQGTFFRKPQFHLPIRPNGLDPLARQHTRAMPQEPLAQVVLMPAKSHGGLHVSHADLRVLGL